MFNFVPGIIVQNAITGMGLVQIRGIDEVFNQKVLFLLDGTQASGGVINVITDNDPAQNTLYAKAGSHQSREASGYFSEKWGDAHQFYLGGETRRHWCVHCGWF